MVDKEDEPRETVTEIVPTADLMSQVQIARQFPRQLAKFTRRATEMACADQETAEDCFYVLKRKNKKTGEEKKIVGPGIRLAEICTQCYGNIRWGGRTIGEEERNVVVQGVAHDLESNVFCQVEVKRRITTSGGYRYNDDMVTMTAMAGIAICMRNAAFKVIPSYLWKPVYEAAMQRAIGDASTLADRRQKMVGKYALMGVGVEKILAYCGKPTLEQVTLEDLTDLIGEFNAVRDGERTVDEVFGLKPEAPEAPRTIAEAKAEAAQSPAAPPTPVKADGDVESAPAGDALSETEISIEEQDAIRATERAEAAAIIHPERITTVTQVAPQAPEVAIGSLTYGGKAGIGAQKNRERLWALLKKLGKGQQGAVDKLKELTNGRVHSVGYLEDEEVANLLNQLEKKNGT